MSKNKKHNRNQVNVIPSSNGTVTFTETTGTVAIDSNVSLLLNSQTQIIRIHETTIRDLQFSIQQKDEEIQFLSDEHTEEKARLLQQITQHRETILQLEKDKVKLENEVATLKSDVEILSTKVNDIEARRKLKIMKFRLIDIAKEYKLETKEKERNPQLVKQLEKLRDRRNKDAHYIGDWYDKLVNNYREQLIVDMLETADKTLLQKLNKLIDVQGCLNIIKQHGFTRLSDEDMDKINQDDKELALEELWE